MPPWKPHVPPLLPNVATCGAWATTTGVLNQSLALLDARYGWLLTLHLWALSVSDLASHITVYTKEPVTRSDYEQELNAAREASPRGEDIAEAVGARLRESIQLRWRELRSIEVVLQEITGEFDGEEPTRPSVVRLWHVSG